MNRNTMNRKVPSEHVQKKKKARPVSPYTVDISSIRKAKKLLNKSDDKELYKRILKITLRSLVGELLPTAILEFRNDPKGSTTYPITNIVAEIRGIISQIETSINVDDIVHIVSEGVSNSLLNLTSITQSNMARVQRNLPMNIHDRAIRKDVEVILTEIGREFEKNIVDTVSEIESKIYSSIKPLFVGKPSVGRKQKRN